MSEFQSLVDGQPPAYYRSEPSAPQQDASLAEGPPPYYTNYQAYSVNSASEAARRGNNDSSEVRYDAFSKFFRAAFNCCGKYPKLSVTIITGSVTLVTGITVAIVYSVIHAYDDAHKPDDYFT